MDALEGRVVLSTGSGVAANLNLTTSGSSGTINGAVFLQDSAPHGGVGVFQPFLRLQGNGTEAGLNTDASSLPYNDKGPANWTHSVPLSAVGVVDYQGTEYRAFGLNINESNANPNLNLAQLQLYTANQPNLTSVNQLGTPLYDLNAGGGSNSVVLNGALSPGLGHSDMLALIPNADFANQTGSYLYLYCKFTGSDGGFEEWNFSAGTAAAPPVAPPPTTVPPASLSGYVTGFQNAPLAGVTVELTGTDVNGNAVDLTAITDVNGLYSFSGLAAGTYTVKEPQPAGVTLNVSTPGTVGGVTDGTVLVTGDIASVTLKAGDQAINYDFSGVVMA